MDRKKWNFAYGDEEEENIPRPDLDGTYDFQLVSDWWTEMLQKSDIKNRRIRMAKKDEGRGNG